MVPLATSKSNSSGINGDCRVNSTELTRTSFSICVALKLCTVLVLINSYCQSEKNS